MEHEKVGIFCKLPLSMCVCVLATIMVILNKFTAIKLVRCNWNWN
jgi:hypothetical protein